MEKTLRRFTFLLIFFCFGLVAYPAIPGNSINHSYPVSRFSFLNRRLAIAPTPVKSCSGQGGLLGGPAVTPAPASYTWQIQNGNTWVNAPGTYNTQNYTTDLLTNSTGSDIVDHIQRLVTPSAGNGTPYTDSFYDVTVSPITPISNNIISAATVSFCTSGDPPLTGSVPAGSNGVFTYQWQSSSDGTVGSYTDITGANTQGYDPGVFFATTYYQRIVSSTSCVIPSVSNAVKITVQQAIANNNITAPAGATFCVQGTPGQINGTLPTGGNGIYTYQWQSVTGQGIYTDINGATGMNYTPGTLLATTSFQRVVKTGGGCAVASLSNSITITVYPNVADNTVTLPATATFCIQGDPDPITGGAPTGGNNIYTYQWQSSPDKITWTAIPSNGMNINYDPPLLTATTYYRRLVTSGVCAPPVSSPPVAITIQPAVSNNVISAPNNTAPFCGSGTPANITGQMPSGGDAAYAYQWQSSTDNVTFTNIAGATTKDLAPGIISATTYYRRSVTSGACITPDLSNVVQITVQPVISNNVVQPLIPNTFCISTDPAKLMGSTPLGGDGSIYSYQWQSSTDNINFSNISSANGINFDPTVITETTYYRRLVTSGACVVPDASSPVSVVVYQQVTGNLITAPAVSEFCVTGQPDKITGATPTQGDPVGYSYQWQSSSSGTAGSFTNITGETNLDLSFTQPLTTTTYYQRIVSSGVCLTPVTSNVVAIIIDAPIVDNGLQLPLITSFCSYVDPAIIPGSPASGGNGVFKYQWQTSTDNVNFTDIPNANSTDYDPPPFTVTTYFRRKIFSGACIDVPTTSAKFTIKSMPSIPGIDLVSPICAGSTVTLNVTSPQADLTYFWYDSPTSADYLSYGNQYITTPLIAGRTYYLSAYNNTCYSDRASVVITVNPQPAAPDLAKVNASACYNSPILLSVANPQSASIYKWYTDQTGGVSFYTGSSYQTPPVVADLNYYVEETNGSGCISSTRSYQHVTAIPALQIIASGADNVCPGTSAGIMATATDPDAIIYWYTNKTGGTSIGNGSPFQTPSVSANTTFWAEAVGNVNGCISPERVPAEVTVLTPLDAPMVTVTDATSSSVTFAWDAVAGAASYQVSIDGGITFTNSSSGGDGLTTQVTDLKVDQSITLIVKAIGVSSCQVSTNSSPVTGTTTNPTADQLYIANAFTPNGDGNNDIVYVHNEKIKSMKFYVYDQWGELLYTSLNQQNGWDGTFKGKKEPVGVYVYYVEAILTDGKQVKKKGTITLLR